MWRREKKAAGFLCGSQHVTYHLKPQRKLELEDVLLDAVITGVNKEWVAISNSPFIIGYRSLSDVGLCHTITGFSCYEVTTVSQLCSHVVTLSHMPYKRLCQHTLHRHGSPLSIEEKPTQNNDVQPTLAFVHVDKKWLKESGGNQQY